MDLIERIKRNFNKGYFNKAMSVDGLPEEFPAWTLKQSGWVGVAIPLDSDISFSETFSSVRIRTEPGAIINNVKYNLLLLTCSEMEYRNEFATICSQFVDPGADGSKRKQLIQSPETWWNHWKCLLGNVSTTQEAYPVLGELIVAEYLLKQGINIRWSGIEHATHDIEADNSSYEIKSTIARYGYEVTISSLYQLRRAGETLDLIFCRFERSVLGRSLDELVDSVVSLGFSKNDVEQALKKENLEPGRPARKIKYKLLEMKKYSVDDTFPTVTESSFKNNRIPDGVIKFTYTIDLSGLPSENLL